MAEFAAQAIKRIKQLPVLTVGGKIDESHIMSDLLHPDSFVAGSQVTLHKLMLDYEMRVHFLGRRIADMNLGRSFLPVELKYLHATDQVSVIAGNDETNVRLVGPLDGETPFFNTQKLGFVTVDIAQLPPIGASHFVSTVVEDDAAVLVAIDGPITVKVMPSLKPEVTVDPNSAAIIPPGSPIFMQGAYSMLFRPVLG